MGNMFCVGSEFVGNGGDPIIKTGAQGDQEIAILNRIVRAGRSMHAQHMQ